MKYRAILCGSLLATHVLFSSPLQAERCPRHHPRCCRQLKAGIRLSLSVELGVVAEATPEAVAAVRLTREPAAT